MSENVWKEPSSRSVAVWKHFLVSKDKKLAKCKLCDAKFSSSSGNSTLRYHLSHRHAIKDTPSAPVTKRSSQSSNGNASTSSASLISSFLVKAPKECPELVLARLVAVDRIPFKTIAESKDIRNGFAAQGVKIPLNRTAM